MQPISTEPILSVRHLVKRFGGLTAVNDVSLDISPGEVVGLVGDNGAGKSTLIKCISGVHHADKGRIVFEGREVRFARPIEAREAGIETIYQDLALAGNLDVSANIFLGREMKSRYLFGAVRTLDEKSMRAESSTILDSLGIRIPQMRKEIEKLSGGQRQAVAIARAIYWNARLMIMDEPTNNLGVPEQRKVMQLIGTLKSQGVPVDPHLPHPARRLRRHRPHHRHASWPQGRGAADVGDQHHRDRRVHGRRTPAARPGIAGPR